MYSQENEITLDAQIGAQIQHLRIGRGLTRKDLAEKVGVTHQQLHKYETGMNRISAGRLVMMSRVLGISPGQFFESVEQDSEVAAKYQRGTRELAKYFQAIQKDRVREILMLLVRVLAEQQQIYGNIESEKV